MQISPGIVQESSLWFCCPQSVSQDKLDKHCIEETRTVKSCFLVTNRSGEEDFSPERHAKSLMAAKGCEYFRSEL